MNSISNPHDISLSRFLLQYKLKGPDFMLNPYLGYINLFPKSS